MQDGWECATAPWWVNRDELGTAYAQTGPEQLAARARRAISRRRQPTRGHARRRSATCRRTVDQISFDVSEIGKPVEVKESYFPNWHVTGAKGPYRLAPNLMVVVPTSTHVAADVRTDERRLGRPRHHGRRRGRARAARALDGRTPVRGRTTTVDRTSRRRRRRSDDDGDERRRHRTTTGDDESGELAATCRRRRAARPDPSGR